MRRCDAAVRWMLRAADDVVGQSRDTVRHVTDMYGVRRPVELIPLGIDRPPPTSAASRQDLGLPNDAFVMITIGRMVARKATTQLIDMFAASDIPNAHLVIVGDGPDAPAVDKRAAELGVRNRVHMLGQVSEAEKYAALSVADAFVTASQHEGFGLVFLEAMAFGLPVLCYDRGGQTDFLVTRRDRPRREAQRPGGVRARAHRAASTIAKRASATDSTTGSWSRIISSTRCAARYEEVFAAAIERRAGTPRGRHLAFLFLESVQAMCGIAGIINSDPQREQALRRMLSALEHRGPDGEGVYHDWHATLGHRRLSIIDLAGGQQPLYNADRSLVLVCNGEIYNYRELRARLEQDGHRFLTHSDCEVILALYERHGEQLLDHLRGMFAFALWDVKRQRLLAARDHLGQKPFFYSTGEQGFAFASEIKALRALDRRRQRMNLAALDQYLGLRLIDAPLTMFEGIHKLPPGHLLSLEAGVGAADSSLLAAATGTQADRH